MLIVSLQDDIDNLFAIWDTVIDRFLGVNLKKNETVKVLRDIKGYSEIEAIDRVENPQPFVDIAKCICEELKTVDRERQYYKFKMQDLRLRCHDSARDIFDNGNYGILHIVTADELKKGDL